jgi:hypothetical protein
MFSLNSSKGPNGNATKFATFADISDAINVCPPDDSTYTYKYLYSNQTKAYTIAQYRGNQLVGFMEADNA